MRKKLKVLFLAADPFRDRAQLALGEEVRAIDQAIQRGSARDAVELVSHFATRTRDLHLALLRHEPQIVHFAGHGGEAGVIYLGDELGNPRAVGKDALGRLFGILEGEVRAVVLNGCDTLPAVEVLSEVVDYAIGTNRRISDDCAIQFAEAFYTALAFGKGVPQAFDRAVNQLQLEGSDEADVPVLRVRPGASDAPLVAVPADAEEGDAGATTGVYQNVTADEIGGSGTRIIADDQEGPPVLDGRVDQTVAARSITGSDVSIIGRRRRGPGRG